MAKDIKKSEMIEWEDHPTLNQVTKEAIRYFKEHFSYDEYMLEKTLLE